jgi:hypothetical protein
MAIFNVTLRRFVLAKRVRSLRFSRFLTAVGLLLMAMLLSTALGILPGGVAYADTSLVVTTLSDGVIGSCVTPSTPRSQKCGVPHSAGTV